MPIAAAAIATSVRNGSMTRVSWTVSSSLPGTRAKSCASVHRTSGRANTMPAIRTSDAGDEEQRVQDVVAEPPRVALAAQRQVPRERRHERRAHRAFGEQIADEIRESGRRR